MARLWSCGFELNSATAGVEFTNNQGTASTISSAQSHGGTYSNLSNITSSGTNTNTFQFSSGSGIIYIRAYIYIVSYPSSNSTFFGAGTSSNFSGVAFMNSSGQIGLTNDAGTYYTSLTSAVSKNTWHYLELGIDDSTANSQIVTGKLDGVQFDSETTSTTFTANSQNLLYWGQFLNGSETGTGELYFDDIAVNNGTGSYQNTYAGAGAITHQRPNAAGDNNQFTVAVGGTAGASNNYTRVDEVTPDNATSYNGDVTSGDIDDFAVSSTTIGGSDTVNVVSVGVVFRAAVASAEASFKARIKKTSGGTVSSSAAITPTSTTWRTNAVSAPRVYPITLYQDPDSNAWTATTLNSAQIGYTISTTNTNAADISTVWMLVDSTPSGAPAPSVSDTTTTSENVVVYITTLFLSVSDTTTTSENVVIGGPANPSVADTTTTSEDQTLQVVSYAALGDTTTTSQNVVITEQNYISVADTTTTSEDQTLEIFSYVDAADTTTTSETVTVIIPAAGSENISVSDTTTTSENVVLYITSLFLDAADTTTTSENPVSEVVSFTNSADTTTTSEDQLLELVSSIDAADTTTTSENVKVEMDYSLAAGDTTTTSENPIIITNYAIVEGDTTTTSEDQNFTSTIPLSVADTTTTSESQRYLLNSYIDSADTTTTSENVVMQVPTLLIVVSDTTTTSERIVFQGSINISDTTTTSENVSVIIPTLTVTAGDQTTTSEGQGIYYPLLQINLNDSTTTSENVRVGIGALNDLNITVGDTTTTAEVVSVGYLQPPVIPSYPTPNAPTPLQTPQISRSLPTSGYEFWILSGDPTRITKILTPYPLDATGTIIQYSSELDDFGQCKFRVSAYDSVLTQFGDILTPHQNWIQVVKNGIIVWQGAIIENTKRTKDYIECLAAEPLWYLSKVMVNRSSLDPVTGTADGIYRIFSLGTMSAAVTAIMNETIATFQANDAGHPLSGMSLGTVTNPNYPPNVTNAASPPVALTGPWMFGNGVTAPELQFDYHTILYILKSFGAYSYSDFYIDNNFNFNFVPFKGNNLTTQVNFQWGGNTNTPSNITNYNIPRFGQRMVNHLYGIATDINGNVLHYDQTDSNSVNTYGYIEGVAAYADVKDQATLNARIQAELPMISLPDSTAISVTQSEKGYPLGTYQVGDIVNINIQNRGVSFNDNRRIVGTTVQVNGTGREYITIQTNKILPFQFALAGGQNSTAQTT